MMVAAKPAHGAEDCSRAGVNSLLDVLSRSVFTLCVWVFVLA